MIHPIHPASLPYAPILYFKDGVAWFLTRTGISSYSFESGVNLHLEYLRYLLLFLQEIKDQHPGHIHTNSMFLLRHFYRKLPYSAHRHGGVRYQRADRTKRLYYLLECHNLATQYQVSLWGWPFGTPRQLLEEHAHVS